VPRHPDDFWGEHSHALHDVLQAPARPVDRLGGDGLVERAGEGRVAEEGPRPRASGSWPARGLQARRAQWLRSVRWERLVRRVRLVRLVSWPDWRGRRLRFAVAGTAGVAVLLAMWTETMSSSPSPTTGQALRPSPLLAGIGSGAALGPNLGRAVHGAANAVASHRRSAAHGTHPIRRQVRRRPAGRARNPRPSNRHATPVYASSPTHVTYPPPTTSSPSGGSSSVTSGGDSAPRNEQTPTAVKASTSHSSPASPTGATGALGPVKSPNG
jgi:hypothetical protein